MRTGGRRTLSAIVGPLATVLCLFPGLVFAQVGGLAGTVLDDNGKPQPNVAVEIDGRSLPQMVRRTTTDREGRYRFAEVPTGTFVVAFWSRGFSWLLHPNVDVGNRTTSLDARLAPGDMSDIAVVINGKRYLRTPSPRARDLVQQLGQLPASLPASGPNRSDGRPIPVEAWRSQVYRELTALGDGLVPTVVQGLADRDVKVRRSVALFLFAAGTGWTGSPRAELRPHLAALTAALGDTDSRVRGWSAHAVGIIGPDASSAIPALIPLLTNPDEGLRNSACIALAGIGPRARAALPALRRALSDSSANVRSLAARAISKIDQP